MAALREYHRKRNFSRTAEPKGRRESGTAHRFVVQKHDASRLHYDFRLELDGTLKSWAVPKGIPLLHAEKRLAVEVEDHPVDYLRFEGTIPAGEYGGGTVMVWDIGTFEPLSKAPLKELAAGKLHFILHGRKLKGEWYLVRLKDGKNWLLIRAGEDMKISESVEKRSAVSGKDLPTLAQGEEVWHSDRKKSPAGSRSKRLPAFLEPMKARLAQAPPVHGEWCYEIKFDGFRALALKAGERVELMSRNEKRLTEKFPELAEAVAGLGTRSAILDGEIVALDPKGRSSFQLLQAYELGEERPPLYFYVFDLVELDGKDLKRRPLTERKALLEELLAADPSGAVRYSGSLGNDAKALLRRVEKLGLEGLVGKKADSSYEAGKRSGAWIKLKLHRQQEFVIGGYTRPEGTRKHLGALLVGVHEGKELRLAGKVGTGFTQKTLAALHGRLRALETEECPFAGLPERRSGRYGQGITAAEMKRCRWVDPVLVAEVKFSEWTRDARLRQPVFLGLREDKAATEVVREPQS